LIGVPIVFLGIYKLTQRADSRRRQEPLSHRQRFREARDAGRSRRKQV
jgi:hypothetical protein